MVNYFSDIQIPLVKFYSLGKGDHNGTCIEVSKIQMENDTRVIPVYKVLLDFFLLMCVGWPILFLFLWGQAYERGFFCDDESLRHPYHDSTVPSIYLYIFGIGMNCFVMILTEYLTSSGQDSKAQLLGHKIPMWIWKSYCVIGVFAFGAACSQLTTDVMKYTIGRLRPHFYTLCLPDINCTDPRNMYAYHTDFKCTNLAILNDPRKLKEVRLSFPSGHSSFSMYTMVYFAVYLQSRMNWNGSKLLRHTLQFLALLSAIFTAMTRVSDYKHHWSDVLSGLLLGTIVAIVITKYVSNLLTNDRSRKLSGVDSTSTELNNLNGVNHRHAV